MKKYLLCSFLLLLSLQDFAAPAYAFRVTFKNKNGTLTFADSLQYLSSSAMLRRNKQGIGLDSTDLPLVQHYIDTAMSTANAVKLHNKSKWLNQIVLITFDSSKITALQALPMVQSVKLVARYANGVFKADPVSVQSMAKFPEVMPLDAKKTRGNSAYYGLAFQQIDMLQGDCLHDAGFMGQGMKIAVIDVNFRRTDSCRAYDTLLMQNRVKDVYNFVKDTAFVYSMAIPTDHGMNVLGCMAAKWDSTYIGTAPYADYYLYISEDIGSEFPIEEDNWLSAAERADSIGVDMINSSLGYNNYDAPLNASSYTYSDLDGNTSLIVKAANLAVAKGIFVVNAQGNEGASPWHYMLTPADGDSVYSVGSVDGSGNWASSGYGPNALGKVKPDGCAMGKGTSLIGGNCLVGISNGSSFASPILCGAIACLWQASPNLSNWQLRQLVKMVSSQCTGIINGTDSSTINTLGYGIPNLCNAYNLLLGTGDIQQIDYTFAVYPNPTQGEFVVKSFDENVSNFSYLLYDMTGKLFYKSNQLYQSSFHSDVLKNAASGTYVLLISTANKVYSTKIIKQ